MKGERHVGGEIRVLSNLIKRCMDDGMPPQTTGMHGWIIGFLHRNEDRHIAADGKKRLSSAGACCL